MPAEAENQRAAASQIKFLTIDSTGMAICPACSSEQPGAFSFCPFCGEPLAPQPARAEVSERRVVTTLFCDLVGFTAVTESADPEDVDEMLAAYFEVARARIEGHGGVVQKFIGDAVVGVFGVPVAHEDDPERAVRAGLRIVEDAERLRSPDGAPLRLRVGVNTGEALVRLDISPGSGEPFLTGDSTNTASRIQAVAPEQGVAVGLGTYEVTSRVFGYEELKPATVKGKSEPVRLFHAIAPLARLGGDLHGYDSHFVGREAEFALLKERFTETATENVVRLVTVVGEPGLGKSRIVAELMAHVDRSSGLVTWRQGRCLPYGEGITFWALGEILKAHTGILESDPPRVAREKLSAVLPEGEEREWFRQRLLPLLGIGAASSAEREELFTAWRRFLEGVAKTVPTVLVFDDLHWADEAMLAFLEHLADLVEGVPLLLVGTARPELFERHPDYADGLPNATRIHLSPLSPAETARLVSGLLEASVLPVEVQQPILDRSGGNPLYAGEFVRLLRDRDLLERTGSSWQLREGAVVPFPQSVQALIAARLDTLEPDAKSLLADAAVIGKVFWAGAVTAMGDRDPQQVALTLQELSRKELVRPSRQSSMEGETEYAFWHVLARDVAYNQLPRASRASRHVAAAKWIESKTSDRVEDLADVLAYHYTNAIDLAQAVGNHGQATELEAPARRFLGLGGERALGLDTAAALASFDRALALTPETDPDRAAALARFGEAALHAGRYKDARDALEQAIDGCQTAGDRRGAAHAMITLSRVLQRLVDPSRWKLPAQALAMLEPLPPGPEHVAALTEAAVNETLQGRAEAGIGYAERALTLAAKLDLPPPASALGFRGMARTELGDQGGLDDYREAIVLATQAGEGRAVGILHNNFAVALWGVEGPAAALEVLRAGTEFAQARGLTEIAEMLTANTLEMLAATGEHEQALALAAQIASTLEASGNLQDFNQTLFVQVQILTLRGHVIQVADTLDRLETTTRESGNLDWIVGGLGLIALARAALGQHARAAVLLTEIDATPGSHQNEGYAAVLPAMVRAALATGNPELAHRLTTGVEPQSPYHEHALTTATAALAEAHGNHHVAARGYDDAARRWGAFGVMPEQAFALLGQGRCLLALHDPTADQSLRHARELFQGLQAQPSIDECNTLLAETAEHAS